MDDAADPDAPEPEEDLPNQAAMANWDEVIADLEATAAEYEEAGWETLQIHPGDVAILTGEDDAGPGLDILVPDPEFEELADVVETGQDVEETAVFRAGIEGVTYLVIVLQHADGTAVLVPAYYLIGDGRVETAFRHAGERGEFRIRLRTLTFDEIVVGHGDPDLFAPGTDEEENEDGD
jgi:hypothetical protein